MAGLAPWGWHRLDNRWVQRLTDAARIGYGDLVLDVGAGDGRITRQALACGASVIAVELHPRRATSLRAAFRDDDVVVVQADAADLRLPRRPFKVVANPPFGIATALLRRLTAPGCRLDCASIVLPAWVVARWVGGRGAGGAASMHTYVFGHAGRVPAHAFSPHAPRDAAILRIDRRR